MKQEVPPGTPGRGFLLYGLPGVSYSRDDHTPATTLRPESIDSQGALHPDSGTPSLLQRNTYPPRGFVDTQAGHRPH